MEGGCNLGDASSVPLAHFCLLRVVVVIAGEDSPCIPRDFSCISSFSLTCVARVTVGAVITSSLLWASTKIAANFLGDLPLTVGRLCQ